MLVDVLVEVNSLDRVFTYEYNLEQPVLLGSKVAVPFGRGNRFVEGFVVNVNSTRKNHIKYKEVTTNLNFCLGVVERRIIDYLYKRNLTSKIAIINMILPPYQRANFQKKTHVKQALYIRATTNCQDLSKKEQAIIEELFEPMLNKDAVEKYGQYLITKLVKKGCLHKEKQAVYRFSLNIKHEPFIYNLNLEQRLAIDKLEQEDFNLLHGVTGSGKTIIYLEMVKKALSKGKTALVLVPEIVLSTQLINNFINCFGDIVALYHSALSVNERNDQHLRIMNGEAKIVIATRSGIFISMPKLGLIIVDEEHEASYKQNFSPSYDAREIAYLKAKLENAKLIFGSATPSVNTYYQAKQGLYQLVELKNSFFKRNVSLQVEDMSNNLDYIFSSAMKNKINYCLEENKQFIIFINRRGYANYLKCKACNEIIYCPNCSKPMTKHLKHFECHLCHFQTDTLLCRCGSSDFIEFGFGTQQVIQRLQQLYPDIRAVRVDQDVKSHLKLADAFYDFKHHKVDCLVGTTMIAKGIDIANVVFVGIINADFTLKLNRLNSRESTFNYLAQASGRTGRSNEKSFIVAQVFDCDDSVINSGCLEDYKSFYESEIVIRKTVEALPFYKYCQITISDVEENTLFLKVKEVQSILKKASLSVFDFQEHYHYKQGNKYFMCIIIKYQKISMLFPLIDQLRAFSEITIDVNTMDI